MATCEGRRTTPTGKVRDVISRRNPVNEEFDAMTIRMHQNGADDRVDVSLAGGAFPEGPDDRCVVNHKDDATVPKLLMPLIESCEDGEGLQRDDLSAAHHEVLEDVERTMRRHP